MIKITGSYSGPYDSSYSKLADLPNSVKNLLYSSLGLHPWFVMFHEHAVGMMVSFVPMHVTSIRHSQTSWEINYVAVSEKSNYTVRS